ncbi:hypothetical protein [Enterococcus columbae]|uniref:hypothetical protein n=1 Tax=Enterococcus columbae TaxID=1355 RepID=UPI00036145EA|nr:hypothetical protein [Enterococcus columbae]
MLYDWYHSNFLVADQVVSQPFVDGVLQLDTRRISQLGWESFLPLMTFLPCWKTYPLVSEQAASQPFVDGVQQVTPSSNKPIWLEKSLNSWIFLPDASLFARS